MWQLRYVQAAGGIVLDDCGGIFRNGNKIFEGLLAIKYRVVDKDGHSLGGPFYYIEQGMGSKWQWLAKIFAFLESV